MRFVFSVIKVPLISWLGFLMVVYLVNKLLGHVPEIKAFCNSWFLLFILVFSILVFLNCSRDKLNFFQTLISAFIFFYISSAVVWLAYIYSESSAMQEISDVAISLLSLLLYPSIFAVITSFVFSGIYFVFRKIF
jgi:hypothetical protein